MNIGVFDSGLGGLIILKSIIKKLPQYNYVYFGDTAHMPYGKKTQQEIYRHTEAAVRFLFSRDCDLVIVACNTASAKALRRLQRSFLPSFPGKRVLGVIVPTLEHITSAAPRRVGLIGTTSTVASNAYGRELKKINPGIRLVQKAAPRLAGLLEDGDRKAAVAYAAAILRGMPRTDALVLGCTHYDCIKTDIRKLYGGPVYSQDELIAASLRQYLRRHSDMRSRLARGRKKIFYFSSINPRLTALAKRWFGKHIRPVAAAVPPQNQ